MRHRTALAVPLTVLALAGCGGDGSGDVAESLTIVGTEFAFDPADVSIAADTPTEVTLDNQGVVEHDWTIDELGVEIYADAGESTTDTVTAPAGTYEVYCSIPGHRDAGMVGELTVRD